jgi:hypothetical protein
MARRVWTAAQPASREQIAVGVGDEDNDLVSLRDLPHLEAHLAASFQERSQVGNLDAGVADTPLARLAPSHDEDLEDQAGISVIDQVAVLVDAEQALGDRARQLALLGLGKTQQLSEEPIGMLFRLTDEADMNEVHRRDPSGARPK